MSNLIKMKLSNNLELVEVTRSETAKRKGIINEPTSEHLTNLKELANKVFQPIREHFKVPIFISSGYRSEALNKSIGGSSSSQHCKGEAIDIDLDGSSSGVTNADVFNFIKSNLDFDQLIWEFGTANSPDWVHVSYSIKNRKQILKAVKINGKTSYINFS
jgi:zinc D-Ala-D-Ala carboxypeptidase|tara:strand:- start:1024 stop:1503 length:480 start_codon:yes stop_codon:yes gene_type:complete